MLKFRRTTGSMKPCVSPDGTPVPSPRRPRLLTRLDSMGGPVKRDRTSVFQENTDEENSKPDRSSSDGEFETPESTLHDVTKRKLIREKKKILKQSAKKRLNVLDSADFFNRQHELKIWINETTGKDVSGLSEKKLKEYFKKFTDKWNKKKLPRKYYRGVDLHSSPLTVSGTDASPLTVESPSSKHNDSGLWIAPPIPMLDLTPDVESHVTSVPTVIISSPTTPCSTYTNTRYATIRRPSSGPPSKLCMDEMSITKPKTPPKPPVRRRPKVITTLSTFSSTESIHSIASSSGTLRGIQPRMGRVMSSIRRSVNPASSTNQNDPFIQTPTPSTNQRDPFTFIKPSIPSANQTVPIIPPPKFSTNQTDSIKRPSTEFTNQTNSSMQPSARLTDEVLQASEADIPVELEQDHVDIKLPASAHQSPHTGLAVEDAVLVPPHTGLEVEDAILAPPHTRLAIEGAVLAAPHTGLAVEGAVSAPPHTGLAVEGAVSAPPHTGLAVGSVILAPPHAGLAVEGAISASEDVSADRLTDVHRGAIDCSIDNQEYQAASMKMDPAGAVLSAPLFCKPETGVAVKLDSVTAKIIASSTDKPLDRVKKITECGSVDLVKVDPGKPGLASGITVQSCFAKRRSGDKRPISMISNKENLVGEPKSEPAGVEVTGQPSTKRNRAVWRDEVENCEEVYV